MIKSKFFTKKSLLALGLGLGSIAVAEDVSNDGKYWYTAKPGSQAVELVDQIKLRCLTNLTTDSVLWKIQGSEELIAGNPLVAKRDLLGAVYYKSNNLWQVDSFSYNGIISYGDTVLVAPNLDNASYYWSRNGIDLPSHSWTSLADSSGYYTVNILLDGSNDTLKYTRYVNKNLGETRHNAIFDANLLGQDLNHFWIVDTNYQYAEWLQDNKSMLPGRRFMAFQDGTVTLLVFKGGKWYKDEATFYGIRRDGHLLRANVSAVKYQWYKDGVAIVQPNSSFLDLSVHGSNHQYSLVATFNTDNGPQDGIYYDFTIGQQGTFDNPITSIQWIKRSGNILNISLPSGFTSIDNIYWISQPVDGAAEIDTTSRSFVLTEPSTVTVKIFSNGLWYQDMGFFAEDSSELGTFENPIETKFIEQQGFTLSVPTHLQGDSIIWFVYSKDTLLTKDYIHFGTSIELYNNAAVVAHVKHGGLWYAHILDYSAIIRDPESNVLQVPVIKDAQYEWFFNGNSIGVHTPSYKPTVAGTYTVVITWVEQGQGAANTRVAQTLKTAKFTFVVDAITGVEEGNQILAGLSLYPNPAQDSFVFDGNLQAIEYRIEDTRSVVVKQGQAAAGVAVSVQDLQPGVYLVHMKTGEASTTKRLVIE